MLAQNPVLPAQKFSVLQFVGVIFVLVSLFPISILVFCFSVLAFILLPACSATFYFSLKVAIYDELISAFYDHGSFSVLHNTTRFFQRLGLTNERRWKILDGLQ